MQSGDSLTTEFVQVMNSLVLQLVETNTALATIAQHITYLGMNASHMVDELATLNSAIGRVEDFHYSAAQKGSPSA